MHTHIYVWSVQFKNSAIITLEGLLISKNLSFFYIKTNCRM